MITCSACNQPMTGTACTSTHVIVARKKMLRLPYTPLPLFGKLNSPTCGVCEAPQGGLHHVGCEIETCPNCKGKLLFCGCQREGRL